MLQPRQALSRCTCHRSLAHVIWGYHSYVASFSFAPNFRIPRALFSTRIFLIFHCVGYRDMAFRSCFLSGFPIFSLICCILLSYQNCAKTFFCFIRTFKLFVLIDRRNASTFLHRLFLIFYRLHLPPSCWLIRFQKFLDFLRHSPLVLRDFGTVMSQFPHLQTRTLLYLFDSSTWLFLRMCLLLFRGGDLNSWATNVY